MTFLFRFSILIFSFCLSFPTYAQDSLITDCEVSDFEAYHKTEGDKFPCLNNCDSLVSEKERYDCTAKHLYYYLYERIAYPTDARRNKLQGNVFLSFTVNRKGYICDTKILKDIGGGCGEEAKRALNTMNDGEPLWIPALIKGEKVNVRYTLPVRFRMQTNF